VVRVILKEDALAVAKNDVTVDDGVDVG